MDRKMSHFTKYYHKHFQHINKLLQLTLHNSVHYKYSALKNFQQFFYMQETNISSNCFIQLLYCLMMGE